MRDETIDKLAIAGMHAEAALQMMAIGCNPFSVHLPVMACSEIVASIAAFRGIKLQLDLEHLIREERRSEWRRAEVEAYNFFKHADRDTTQSMTNADLARIEALNDLTMLANLGHLHDLGFQMHRAYQGFSASIMLIYPDIMNWEMMDAEYPKAAEARIRLGHVSRSTVMEAMRVSLRDAGLLPIDQH